MIIAAISIVSILFAYTIIGIFLYGMMWPKARLGPWKDRHEVSSYETEYLFWLAAFWPVLPIYWLIIYLKPALIATGEFVEKMVQSLMNMGATISGKNKR